MDDPRRQLTGSALTARLELYTIYDTTDIRIGGQEVPLEYDQTAVRALFTTEGKGWTRELSGLLNNVLNDPNDPDAKDHLFALEPHRRGRIPVVLVHGTASSPFRWADMVNDLLEDKEIRDHYEFWFFTYNTGNPIPLSADVLRHSLEDAVRSLGGVQADPALGRMVVIGHSQGGLLTKMISIESGTKIWDAISDRPVDELNLKPETKALLKDVAVRPPAALRRDCDLHRHAARRQLSGQPDGGRLVHEAGDAADHRRDRCRRHDGQRRRCTEAGQGAAVFLQRRRHVARQPGDRDYPGDSGGARHPRALHYPDAAGRPAGYAQRRRRGIQKRPHRRRRVRGGDRTLKPLDPVQPAHRARGAAHLDRGAWSAGTR